VVSGVDLVELALDASDEAVGDAMVRARGIGEGGEIGSITTRRHGARSGCGRIRARHFIEIGAGLQHGEAEVIEVEERLQLLEPIERRRAASSA
jgi:hypothetical protein